MPEAEGAITPNRLRDMASDAARLAAPVFEAKSHEWAGCGVPDAATIAATLTQLTESAGELDNGSSGTGGFQVHHWFEDGRERYAITLELGSVVGPSEGGKDQ